MPFFIFLGGAKQEELRREVVHRQEGRVREDQVREFREVREVREL